MNNNKYIEMMNKVNIPEEMDKEIKKSILSGKRHKHINIRLNKYVYAAGSVVAAFALVFTIGMSNPTLAKNIPLIGHIFQNIEKDANYKGNYNNVGKQLTSENDNNKYKKLSDGITINLSETYCNSQALYITMEIKSKEEWPEMDYLELFTEEKYSFNTTSTNDALVLQGHIIDKHTYVGMIRFDLNQKITDINSLPDSFGLDLTVSKIKGLLSDAVFDENAQVDSEYAVMNGPWDFNVNVDVNTKETIQMNLSDRAKDGLGFSSIVKDRFEIAVYSLNEDPNYFGDYFPVVLSSNGRVLTCSDSISSYAIGDEDSSYVELFLFDENDWLDDIKTKYWITPDGLTNKDELATFRDIMLERCKYHTKVEFE